jgi:hypothetical protein
LEGEGNLRSVKFDVVVIRMMIFWVLMACRLVGRYEVSEIHTVSIFSPED